MSRRMSVSMTIDAVRARQKTVTRRNVDTWKNLKPGDRLTLIEKGMGLAKGEKQVVICEVEVTDVRVEPIGLVHFEKFATRSEGLGRMSNREFIHFWLRSHGYPAAAGWATPCRRIEWRYFNEAAP